jgi:uncharacterized protein (DUF433 family)
VTGRRHPLINIRECADGSRRAVLAGTRLSVHQIVSTLRGEGGSVDAASAYLAISPAQVRAVVAYYEEFSEESDRGAAEDAEFARREEERSRQGWRAR